MKTAKKQATLSGLCTMGAALVLIQGCHVKPPTNTASDSSGDAGDVSLTVVMKSLPSPSKSGVVLPGTEAGKAPLSVQF